MELVSVIIPTHYRADMLEKAIKSVRTQTWKNLEIIVVSDGYDYYTDLLIDSLNAEESRLHFYCVDPPQGGNHARNVGIMHSTAKYIAFLDDDDVWYPTKIEKQMYLLLRDKKIGLVGCGIQVINTTIHRKYSTIFKKKENIAQKILYGNFIGSTSCVLVKREVFETCGYFDENLPARQDHDLWIRICQEYNVDFVDSIQMDYHVYDAIGDKQQVSKNLDKFIQAHNILMKKYKSLYEKLSARDFNKLLAVRYNAIAMIAYKVRNTKITKEYAQKSWKQKHNIKALYFCYFSWIPYTFLVRLKSCLYTKSKRRDMLKLSQDDEIVKTQSLSAIIKL